ncbi:MAG: hypothetical protein GDA50_05190, partial [Alphaproteobacteria bacterium GM202ARS2]|nr:hypothetical protein [Alphaproteobacteria bacterium GM202ARS2]
MFIRRQPPAQIREAAAKTTAEQGVQDSVSKQQDSIKESNEPDDKDINKMRKLLQEQEKKQATGKDQNTPTPRNTNPRATNPRNANPRTPQQHTPQQHTPRQPTTQQRTTQPQSQNQP